MSERYCFMSDDDGHDYLIPLSMKEEFNDLFNNDNNAFIDKFDEMRTGCSPSCYSFTDPQYEK